MDNLQHIKARLASIAELRDLVGALRALAATQSRAAVAALAGTKRYLNIIENTIARAVLLPPETATTNLDLDIVSDDVLVAVCSEHGFVGSFNEQIINRAAAVLEDGESLIVAGQQGAVKAFERQFQTEKVVPMTTHVEGVPAVARELCNSITSAGRARLVFARYRQGATYDIVTKNVLPLSPDLLERSEQLNAPLHYLPADVLLEKLASEYLFAEVAHALMESLASENGARLRTMESASENIERKLDKLHNNERNVRQEQITEELLDVVTGAEAVQKLFNSAGDV